MASAEKSLVCEITIADDENDSANQAKCDPQLSSVFFSPKVGLPVEVRDAIFGYALIQHEDTSRPYNEETAYYRPGHHAPQRVHANILLTCRRIWLEYNRIPIRSAVHTFWFNNGPPNRFTAASHFQKYFRNLTYLNLANLGRVQLFTEMRWLETCCAPGLFNTLFSHASFCPKVLTITIRHSDWPNWQDKNKRLSFHYAWAHRLLNSIHAGRIPQIEFELETTQNKEAQLDGIVKKLVASTFLPVRGDGVDTYEGGTPGTRGWKFQCTEEPQKTRWTKGNIDYVVTKVIWQLTVTDYRKHPCLDTLPSVTRTEAANYKSQPSRRSIRSAQRLKKWHTAKAAEESEVSKAWSWADCDFFPKADCDFPDVAMDVDKSARESLHDSDIVHGESGEADNDQGKRSRGRIPRSRKRKHKSSEKRKQLEDRRALRVGTWVKDDSLLEMMPLPSAAEKHKMAKSLHQRSLRVGFE